MECLLWHFAMQQKAVTKAFVTDSNHLQTQKNAFSDLKWGMRFLLSVYTTQRSVVILKNNIA